MGKESGKQSVWVVLGCGCLAVIVVVLAIMTLATLSCYQWVKDAEASMVDPQARDQYAMEILGTDRLPEGYYTILALNLPWIAEIAVLSDRPAKENGEPQDFGEWGFVFVRGLSMMSWFQDEEQLRDYIEGRSDDAGILGANGIRLDVQEIIDRGSFSREDAEIWYVTFRGRVAGEGPVGDGVSVAFQIQCRGDDAFRFGVWFGPNVEEKGEGTDYSGSAADLAALQTFLEDFDLCR